jgi:hypothetical protein
MNRNINNVCATMVLMTEATACTKDDLYRSPRAKQLMIFMSGYADAITTCLTEIDYTVRRSPAKVIHHVGHLEALLDSFADTVRDYRAFLSENNDDTRTTPPRPAALL